MTRVLSGAVLAALAVWAVWFAPPVLFLIVAMALLLGAAHELVGLARAGGLDVPVGPALMGAALTLAAFATAASGRGDAAAVHVVLLAQLVAVGALTIARWRGGPGALGAAAAALFPSLYVAMPLGALVTVRELEGPPALFLLMLTIMASDTAQYYAGRLTGRRPLAPAISPKKTIEGAAGGFAVGTVVFVSAGIWWLPQVPATLRALLGATVVLLGIAGDLFESMLKRSAGVKDSSAIIPGHGGVLDRIDALLFAAPVYYIVLRYL